jgi:hypothetical protein
MCAPRGLPQRPPPHAPCSSSPPMHRQLLLPHRSARGRRSAPGCRPLRPAAPDAHASRRRPPSPLHTPPQQAPVSLRRVSVLGASDRHPQVVKHAVSLRLTQTIMQAIAVFFSLVSILLRAHGPRPPEHGAPLRTFRNRYQAFSRERDPTASRAGRCCRASQGSRRPWSGAPQQGMLMMFQKTRKVWSNAGTN